MGTLVPDNGVFYEIKKGKHGYYYVLYCNGEMIDCSSGYGSLPDDRVKCEKDAISDKYRMEAKLERYAMGGFTTA